VLEELGGERWPRPLIFSEAPMQWDYELEIEALRQKVAELEFDAEETDHTLHEYEKAIGLVAVYRED
jgi:hypothetical protein